MTQTTATRERPILFSGPMIRAILDARKTQTRRVVKPQPVHIPEGPATTAGWLWPPGAEPGEDGAWWGDKSPPNSPAEAMGHCCPYGQPGDRLWVRETFSAWFHGCHWSECTPSSRAALSNLFYRATHPYPDDDQKWIPSIHMPRWASRITLEIAGVRVERLNEITGRDARSEGCEPDWEAFNDATIGMEGWEEPEAFIEECEEECDWVNYGRKLVQSSKHREWERDRTSYALRLAYRALWDSVNGKAHPWESNCWVWVVEFQQIPNR